MDNNILLFRLYITFTLFFLLPISLTMTQQMSVLIKNYFLIFYIFYFSNQNIPHLIGSKFSIYCFDFYINRKKFFLCISLAELSLSLFPTDKSTAYRFLAYCFQKNDFLYVAEYYYLKVLAITPNDIKILNDLMKIYNYLGKSNKVEVVHNQINQLISSSFIE